MARERRCQAWALLLLLLVTTFTERNRKIMARLTWKYQIDQCWDEVAVSWMKPVQRHRAGSAAKAGAKITGTSWRDVPTLPTAMQREKNPLNQSTIWKDCYWPCLLKQVTVPTQEIVIQIQFIVKCSDLQNPPVVNPILSKHSVAPTAQERRASAKYFSPPLSLDQ